MKTSRRRFVGALAALLWLPALGGCLVVQDDICSEGHQPIYDVNSPTGKACLPDGEPVPEGFALYPAKRVPQKVGDEYDRWPLAEDYPWPDEVVGR